MTSFWKTKKGLALQICLVINVFVLIYVQPPIIYYSPYLLLAFVIVLLLISFSASKHIPTTANIYKPFLKYIAIVLMLSIAFGWPYLRLTALASQNISSHIAEKAFTLTSYNRMAGYYSVGCRYRITLINSNEKYSICAKNIKFSNISKRELLSLKENKSLNVIAYINNSLGVSIVNKIEKI